MALLALLTVCAAPVLAEPPPSVTDKMPFDIPYGMPIGLVQAQELVATAEAVAKTRGWKLNIAVVDTHGDLVAFARMDGAQLASVAIAQRKARIAARFRRDTRVFAEAMERGHPYVTTLDPEMVASPGGIPLVANGKIIGAIGCSGGTGDQDATVCEKGIDTLR